MTDKTTRQKDEEIIQEWYKQASPEDRDKFNELVKEAHKKRQLEIRKRQQEFNAPYVELQKEATRRAMSGNPMPKPKKGHCYCCGGKISPDRLDPIMCEPCYKNGGKPVEAHNG